MVTGPNRSGLRMILPSSHYTRALRKPEKRCQNHCLLSWSTRSRVWAQSFSPFLCVLAVTVSIMYMLWPMWECIFHFRNRGLVPILKKLFCLKSRKFQPRSNFLTSSLNGDDGLGRRKIAKTRFAILTGCQRIANGSRTDFVIRWTTSGKFNRRNKSPTSCHPCHYGYVTPIQQGLSC